MAAPRNTGVKAEVLRAATQLLHTQAFAEISLSDIAAAAGISKGTLYYYYKSKDEILLDIAETYLDVLAERLQKWTSDPSKDTSYRRLVRYVFQEGIFDESGTLRLYLLSAAALGNEKVRQKLLEKYAQFKTLLAQKFAERQEGACDKSVWLVLALMDGLLIQNQLGNTALDIPELIETLVEAMDHNGDSAKKGSALN